MTDEQMKQLRTLCKTNLLSYAQWVFEPFGSFAVKPFHEEICNALEEVFIGKTKNLIITMPPRTWKSALVSQIFPARAMGVNPRMQFMLASYSPELAKEFSNKAKRYVTSERHEAIFWKTELRQAQAQEWENSLWWKFVATSVGWVATWKWANVLIVDDVVKNAEEASSPTYRNKVWEWYTQVLSTRKQNDKSATIICMTRWHVDDLVGRIQKLEEQMALEWIEFEPFKLLNIKWLIENPEYTGTGNYEDKWKSFRPERFSVNSLRRIQMQDPRWFEALYMQDPIWAMGWLLNPDDLIPCRLSELDNEATKRDLELWIGIDPALSSNSKSCDTAIVLTGRRISTGQIYILDLCADTFAPTIAINYLYLMINRWEAMGFHFRFVGCEDVGQFNAWMVEFRNLLNESQVATWRRDWLYHYKPRGKWNKLDRITYNLEPAISWKQTYLNENIRADYKTKLLTQILEFPNSEKVDMVDALAQVIEIRKNIPKSLPWQTTQYLEKTEPWEPKKRDFSELHQTIHWIII